MQPPREAFPVRNPLDLIEEEGDRRAGRLRVEPGVQVGDHREVGCRQVAEAFVLEVEIEQGFW